MILQRLIVFYSLAQWLHFVAAQVQEAALVASSSFRMAVSPTFSPLAQGTLVLIRLTAANGLKELQRRSDLPYLLNKTKIVLQQADLQVEENLTIIHFFALTTQMTISVPPGTAFLEVRQRDADNRQSAFDEFVESATGNLEFMERLQHNAKLMSGKGDGNITADTLSQILAIKSVAVAPVTTPGDIPDGPAMPTSTEAKKLSLLDIFLIMLIVAIFFAIVYILIQFRRNHKESNDAGQPAERNDSFESNRSISPDFHLGNTLVIDEEAARPTSSDDASPEMKVTPFDIQNNSDRSNSPARKVEILASDKSTTFLRKYDNDASSISTPSICSSKSASSCITTITSAKSLGSSHSTKNGVEAALCATSIAGLQAISLSRSDSVAFVDDDISDDVVELLKTTLGGSNEILGEMGNDKSVRSRPDATATGTGEESFASDFFGSEGSSSSEGNFRGGSTRRHISSSSSCYSSDGSSSSDDLFKVDVETATKKSGSVDGKQSSTASVKEWMKTVQVVSGSSTTDSKTTSSSQERSSVSSLTAPSMAASIGVSSLELSLSRLDFQAKKSTIKEDEECVEI